MEMRPIGSTSKSKTLNKDINIFVACHKDSYVPKNDFLIPIQVGAEITNKKLDMIGDNTGENISALNPYFCELTAQYWAWKNVDCEYYGFCHYRRYFSFANFIGPKKLEYSDLCLESITDGVLKQLGINETNMAEIINKYDIILPVRAKLNRGHFGKYTVYHHYKDSPQHDIDDLKRAVNIIHELYPHFDKYVKRAIHGTQTYFLNMYIMKKKYFFEYCEWLFPILFKFHEQKNYADLSVYAMRTPGLIAERLIGVFMLYLKDKYKDLKVCELQNTFFEDTSDPYPLPINENKTCICFATDANYAKHLGVALQSVADNASTDNVYDVIVFDNNISYNSKELLNKTIRDKKNISLRFIKTADYLKNKSLFERGHISKSCYLRFAILDLLRNYEKVIYLDSDLVVNKDIAHLYSVDLKDNYVGAVRDSVMATWNNLNDSFGAEQRKYNKNELGLENVFDYFNSGVMIFNVKEMRRHITTDQLFDMATSKNYNWQDQDILNKVCYGKVHYLPSNWNFMAQRNIEPNLTEISSAPKDIYDNYMSAKHNPYIVHFAGHCQPMYMKDVSCAEIFWKYAKNSLFYEDMLAEMFSANGKKNEQSFKSRVILKAKKLFPKGTLRGNFARKVYHLLIKLKRN